MLAWEKSYRTWNPKQSYLKSGICLDIQGLHEYMLFVSQAVDLNIWLVKTSACNQGVYTCFFLKWHHCEFLIIWAFISHKKYTVLDTGLCGKTWGKKPHRLLRNVCEKYWKPKLLSFPPQNPTNTTGKGKAECKTRPCYDRRINQKLIVNF